MRRTRTLAPWVMCAFVLVSVDLHAADSTAQGVGLPAARAGDKATARRAKSPPVNRCVSYSQRQLDTGMRLQLDNQCGEPLSCTMKWSVTCHREDGTRNAHRKAETFALLERDAYTVDASAAQCGDDAWQVGRVRWSCRSEVR